MSERELNLRQIVLDRKYTGNPYVTEIIEVKPLTDDWLISPERTWEEVDGILEGRLQAIQSAFQFDREPTKIAKAYGIERPVSGNMARFLAYTELLDEYRMVSDEHASIAKTNRSEYEKEKDAIKQSSLKKGRKSKLIDERWKFKYNPLIQTHSQDGEKAKKLQELILRKAVTDIFSSENQIIEALPKILRESKTSFNSNLEETTQHFRGRKPIDYLVDSLGEYLSHTQDGLLFSKYSYRESSVIVTKREECEVLANTLNLALDTISLTDNPADSKQLEKLGKSFFMFLKKRASYFGQRNLQEEEYPHLSFLYDVLTASLYKGNSVVLQKISEVIDPYFADLIHSSQVRREADRLIEKWWQLASPAYMAFTRLGSKIPSPNEAGALKSLPSAALLYVGSEMYALLVGLSAYKTLTQPSMSPNLITSTETTRIMGGYLMENAIKKVARISMSVNHRQDMENYLGLLPRDAICMNNDVGADLLLFVGGQVPFTQDDDKEAEVLRVLRNRGILSQTSDPQIETRDRVRSLQAFLADYSGHDNTTVERQTLRHYLMLFWIKEQQNVERYQKENEFLWREILDNPTWFVSPRGDRFSQRGNPQLTEMGINSVSFSIDRIYPREHKVRLRLTGIDQPLELWLDTHKNLLNSSHQMPSIDIALKRMFENTLLKRLYFITSGLLSAETIVTPGNGDDTFSFEYRRAHYRYLTSTMNRPITMESYGAQIHAKEILEDYGIDIFREIRRRRTLGTIKPNEYFTFVREIAPRVASMLILPNELKYNPELVTILV